LAVVDGDGSDRCTVEIWPADVIVGADTCRTRRSDEPLRQVVGIGRSTNPHRTLFDPREYRRYVLPGPAGQLPAVVVEIAAFDPHHPVHRAGAAEHTTGVLRDPPVGASVPDRLRSPSPPTTRTAGRRQRRSNHEFPIGATASIIRTVDEDSPANRPATAQPAEPAPTTMKS
jgi:hypothetical protein